MKPHFLQISVGLSLLSMTLFSNQDCKQGYKLFEIGGAKRSVCALDPTGELVDVEFQKRYQNRTMYEGQLHHNQAVLQYAEKLSKNKNNTNTKCYEGHAGKGNCWDLAACAITEALEIGVWGCWANQPHGSTGPYMDPCYQWGSEIKDKEYWQAVIKKENLAKQNFILAGVLPGDILQLRAYTQYCNGKEEETTGAGHHSAVIQEVYENYLVVCQQNNNGNPDDVCGGTLFRCPESDEKVTTTIEEARADYVRIYRPDGTQVPVPESKCDACTAVP